ncbi:hypothetical protein WICPIJ_006824 [Wickerhamomyces pijperi]|uniref:Uncharacterized protein n=1 Tax=Wickerhamomyces pijperi TaxID=599730 RepID=A0A9P8TJU7_WICPI|nr:hypothetical protein WICPIJ_006824 [Wickerhamomyces pijperi]
MATGSEKQQTPRNSTPLAVGLGIGIPVVVAIVVIAYFMYRGKKRHQREEEEGEEEGRLEMEDDVVMLNTNPEFPGMISKEDLLAHVNDTNTTSSDSAFANEGKVFQDQQSQTPSQESITRPAKSQPQQKQKKRYFTPAYKQQQMKRMSSTSLSQASASQYNNMQYATTPSNTSIISKPYSQTSSMSPPPHPQQAHQVSSYPSSLNMNTSTNSFIAIPTNLNNSEELSRMLNGSTHATPQHHTPTANSSIGNVSPTRYNNHNRTNSSINSSILGRDEDADSTAYPLQNNIYDQSNEFEIQEEDQYVNEFTNYEENKRAFIQELRPKRK